MSETDGAAQEQLYRAAVGPRKESYYVPRFLKFDTAGDSRVSWNWPAFFVTFIWMLYRRMFGYALAYFFVLPIALYLVGFALVAALGPFAGIASYYAVALGVIFILVPMFANALYHRCVKRKIAKKAAAGPATKDLINELERGPHTSNAALIVVPIFLVFIVGILAAIAIPAYQDYTLRSQVTEGLYLASGVKASVADSFAQDDAWPGTLDDLQYGGQTTGKYVKDITVEDGTIVILYGGQANRLLAGEVLALRPTVSANGEVVWGCGYGVSPGTDPSSGPAGPDDTSVPKKYLPAACRGL